LRNGRLDSRTNKPVAIDHTYAYKNSNKQSARGKALKQLNQSKLMAQILALTKPKRTVRRPVKRLNTQRKPRNNGITATNVPMEIAYKVQQNTVQRTHVESSREYIGNVTFLPDNVNSALVFMMNPLAMPSTRLARIAANYQKYRFRSMALTMQSSTTTSTNGLYILGYQSNPDASFPPGQAIAYAFDLPGANSCNVWRTCTSRATIEDPNKWYNVDNDSAEIMSTTQGYFIVVLQTPPSTSGPVTFPVILDYTVEFKGTALNTLNPNAPLMFPSGTFSSGGSPTFTVDPDETISVPAMVAGTCYQINPAYTFNLSGSDDRVIGFFSRTGSNYYFYESPDTFNEGASLTLGSSQSVLRTTITPLN
jgi:hypothetical protein